MLFFLSALPRSGHAATAPSAAPERYQGDLLGETLTRHSLRLETAPEGKRIERIVIVTGEVFDHRDPWPLLLNSLHATTRPEVISRELLFREGDPWLNEKITETERNLRATLFVSVARIVPARGTAANTVVALVLTKDLWSLRTNFDFSYLGGRLEHFLTELEERNLGGTNRNTALTFETDLGAWSVGQRYGDPYLAGTELRLDQRAALYFNRATGRNEGGYGLLSVEAPLR
ncbi:MAG: hypothetical protein NDJ90_16010, partial [Oligoflexia bacterium]|nr:hypothetical protein [Oligoflexia bacterium]